MVCTMGLSARATAGARATMQSALTNQITPRRVLTSFMVPLSRTEETAGSGTGPALVGAAVAGPEEGRGAVGRGGVVDVEAQRREPPVADGGVRVERPLLVG